MITGPGFYQHKNRNTTLCMRVLKVHHRSEKGYIKIKVDWWVKHSGMYWGHFGGMPKNWKCYNEKDFERFTPEWAKNKEFLF